MTVRRERSAVEREDGAVPINADPAPAREAGEVERAGLERQERFEASPEPYAIGSCRICMLGTVVLVRQNRGHRPASDVRAFCLFCNRELDPCEVEPR